MTLDTRPRALQQALLRTEQALHYYATNHADDADHAWTLDAPGTDQSPALRMLQDLFLDLRMWAEVHRLQDDLDILWREAETLAPDEWAYLHRPTVEEVR